MHADDPEHILWTLTIQRDELRVDVFVWKTKVQGGHKLVTDSFSITTTGMKPGVHFGGDTAIRRFKNAFPGSTFTVDASRKNHNHNSKDLINKTGVLIFYPYKSRK